MIYHENDSSQSRVEVRSLLDEWLNFITAESVACLKSEMDTQGFASLVGFNNCGLEVSVDLSSLNINIKLRRGTRRKRKFSVSSIENSVNKRIVIRPKGVSGYLNFRGVQDFQSSSNNLLTDANTTAGNIEGVLNFDGLVFENRFTYSETNQGAESRWTRDYTRVVWDQEKSMTRLAFGDVEHLTRGFQDRVFGTGFSFSREFSINPRFFRSSFRKFNVYIDNPGMLEIYVNGRLVKRSRVQQGPIELSDFPFISGENAVRVKVVDDFGGVKEVDFSNITDARLLSSGIKDFGLSLVFPRQSSKLLFDFEDDYDFDEGVLTGFYQFGVRDALSFGLESQVSKNRGVVGVESTYAGLLGLTRLNFAGSYKNDFSDQGMIARLENESLIMKEGKIQSFRLISGIEYKTKDFETYNDSLGGHRLLVRSSVGQNFRNSIRGSLGVSKSWTYEDEKDKTFIFSNFGWNFAKNWDLSSSIKINLEDNEELSVLFSLTWYSPVRNNQWISTFDPVSESGNTEFSSFPLEGRDNLRMRVGADNSPDFRSVNLGLDYFNQRYELRAGHSSALSGRSNTSNASSIGFGTGLAFVGSHWGLVRPINNSFALIGMKGKPKGLKVPISRFGRSRRAEINSWGPAALVTLAPYYLDRVTVDVSSLPYGLSIEKENFEFKPTYKSGLYLDAKVEGQTSLSGLTVRADGGSVSYLTGSLYEVDSNGSQVVAEFFTGVGGDFIVEKVESKNYFLKFSSEDKDFKLIKINVGDALGIYHISEPLVLEEEI